MLIINHHLESNSKIYEINRFSMFVQLAGIKNEFAIINIKGFVSSSISEIFLVLRTEELGHGNFGGDII